MSTGTGTENAWMPEAGLSIHHVAKIEADILGPGRRVAVWTAGCPMRCPGCIEEPLQSVDAGQPWSPEELHARLLPFLRAFGAITFSGGEPLYHRKALFELLALAKQDAEVEVMLYTGYSAKRFLREYSEFHPLIDLCVAGPFVEQLHGDFLWRGSSNQEFLSPSGKYDEKTMLRWRNSRSSGVQLHLEEGFCYTYGIPVPGSMGRLKKKLEQAGLDLRLM